MTSWGSIESYKGNTFLVEGRARKRLMFEGSLGWMREEE